MQYRVFVPYWIKADSITKRFGKHFKLGEPTAGATGCPLSHENPTEVYLLDMSPKKNLKSSTCTIKYDKSGSSESHEISYREEPMLFPPSTKGLIAEFGFRRLDEHIVFGKTFRYLGILEPDSASRLKRLTTALSSAWNGNVYKAKYPVLPRPSGKRADARMLILEGEETEEELLNRVL